MAMQVHLDPQPVEHHQVHMRKKSIGRTLQAEALSEIE
jgi:hypothetical protein